MNLEDRVNKGMALYAEEDGDCLIWKGSLSTPVGHPKYGGLVLRRAVWMVRHGDLKPAELVTTTCGNPRCLAHLAKTNKAEVARKTNADPRVKASKRLKSAAYARARSVKLTMDKVREMRSSDESDHVLAERYSVDHSMVNKIRNNRAWVESFASPFAGLMK